MTQAIPETIEVSDDGYALPISELLTGRGAAFGKSGSGKSNSISVIAEELLSIGLPIVIVDIEGEYWGLTERFDVTHAGTTPEADVAPSVDVVDELVDGVLVDNRPLVLDLSGITDSEEVEVLLTTFITRLFERELEAQKPCLLFVEEVHEFLPQSGSRGELTDVLITVAKRGRKRGLGLCGASQRPAAVDKEFITQCEWIAWHRLTWENDTKVVEKILGREASETITTLETGEALVMTDWDGSLTRTKFRRKDTFDAGATPDLTAFSEEALLSPDESATDSTASPDSTASSDSSDPSDSSAEDAPAPREAESEPQEVTSTSRDVDPAPRPKPTPPKSPDTTVERSSSPGIDASDDDGDSFDPLEEAAFLLIHAGSVTRYRLSLAARRLATSIRDRAE